MKKHFYPEPTAGLPVLPDGLRQYSGHHDGRGRKIGIVAARFNIELSGALVTSAVETLCNHGVAAADIQVVWVPGSFEIPLMLERLDRDHGLDAMIACGVVLEGKTRHAELIMHTLTRAFARIASERNCPVIDAVVSAHTLKQAEERCLSGGESRGAYAALAALECATLGL